jgi:short-subunit dehydrogenase
MTNNEVVLITGATSGIGYELAKLFAVDNYTLIIVSRDELRLEEVAREFSRLGSPRVVMIVKDLSVPGAAQDIFAKTESRGLQVDILVNDAGVAVHGLFSETNIEAELAIIQLNIVSLVHLTKLYLKPMLKRNRGKILQLASVASYQPTPLLSVYAATKAFVLSFTDSLVNELEDTGVSVTALIPGPTDTDFFRKAKAENTKAALDHPDDPAEVARIGYEGLMAGKNHAIPKNVQRQVALSNVIPNKSLTSIARKQMEEVK